MQSISSPSSAVVDLQKASYNKILPSSLSPSFAEKEFLNIQQADGSTPTREVNMTFIIDGDQMSPMNKSKMDDLQEAVSKKLEKDSDEVSVETPTTKASILNCPWAVLPFVFGMFTLVNALKKSWLD